MNKTVSGNFRLSVWILVALLAVIGGGFLLYQKFSPPASPKFPPLSQTVSLDKKYEFPALDRSGVAQTSRIGFSLTLAQKTNQIYIKNKPVRTSNQNAFLVLSLELKNDTDKRLYFYSADLVRLLSSEEKKFEADFKNPRLEIAPFSTKKDRLAFLVDEEQDSFQIEIGEIIGAKETVKINF